MERTDALQTLGAVLVGALLVSAGVGLATLGEAPTQPAAADDAPNDVAANSGNSTITVSTTGTASAEPDRAVVRLSVESTADDPTDARTAVANNVSSLRDALTDMGLEESQIRTMAFNLYRDDHRPRGAEDEGPVYRAQHAIVVEVEEIDRVGEVIDTAIDSGASSVHDVRFTVSEETREELRHRALQEAMNKSDARANTLASSAGLTVSDTRSISTATSVSPYRGVELAAAGDGGGGSTDINSGPVSVTVEVQVTYAASESA